MNCTIIVLSFFFGLTRGFNKTRINEGASTSGVQNRNGLSSINLGVSTSDIHYPTYESLYRLTSHMIQQQMIYAEKCKIHEFVDDRINIIALRARDNRHFRPNFTNVPESLSEFYSEVAIYLRYGARFNAINELSRPLPNFEERIQYYVQHVQSGVLQTLMDSCILPQPEFVRQNVQNFSNIVLGKMCSEDKCLNGDRQRLPIDSELPEAFVINGIKIRRYDIIPERIIHLFFGEWAQSSNQIKYRNECLRAFFNNFPKVLAAQDGAPGQQRNIPGIKHLLEAFSRSKFHGNSIYGPAKRLDEYFRHVVDSPVEPELQVGAFYLFEYDSVNLIERQQYQELLNLFKRLIDYVGVDTYETNAFERFMTGLDIYETMMTIFSSYDAPPMNFDKWEKRLLNNDESLAIFKDLDEEKEFDYLFKTKFWFIKKQPKKSKRSVYEPEESLSEEQIWSEFILCLTSVFVQTKIFGKSVTWSDSFSRLYSEYQSSLLSSNIHNSCSTENFDTFLYWKISSLKEWSGCIEFEVFEILNEWCQAWKRIMNLKLGIGDRRTWKKIKNEQLNDDLGTVINWLERVIFNDDRKKVDTNLDFGYIVYI